MPTRILRAVRNALVLALALLCLASQPASADVVEVRVINFDFDASSDPGIQDAVIRVGDTVRWVWDEGFHSTTSNPGQAESWDSGEHGVPFTFEHTFNNVGVFNYFCTVHGSGMAGTVTVASNVDFTGEFAGTIEKPNGSESPFALRIHEVQGTTFHGEVALNAVDFRTITGTISPTGELSFRLVIRRGRRRTTYRWEGQFSEDANSISGTIVKKVGTRRTNLTFTATRQ